MVILINYSGVRYHELYTRAARIVNDYWPDVAITGDLAPWVICPGTASAILFNGSWKDLTGFRYPHRKLIHTGAGQADKLCGQMFDTPVFAIHWEGFDDRQQIDEIVLSNMSFEDPLMPYIRI